MTDSLDIETIDKYSEMTEWCLSKYVLQGCNKMKNAETFILLLWTDKMLSLSTTEQ